MHVFQREIANAPTPKDRSLLSIDFAKQCIASVIAVAEEDIVLTKSEHGKPFISSHRGWYFNLSHSADLVIVAVGKTDVGVDLQKHVEFKAGVAKRIFSDNEYATYEKLNEDQKRQMFFNLWTLKEAALKCLGVGMRYPMNQVQFESKTRTIDWLLKDHLLLPNPAPVIHCARINTPPEYTAHIAVGQPGAEGLPESFTPTLVS